MIETTIYKTRGTKKLQINYNNKLFYVQNKSLSTQYLSINTLRCRK